jgi:hypothetical protein
VFFLLALILLVALPSPWRFVGFLVCLVLFAGEIVFWNRRVRGQRVEVGAATLIGRTGTVVSACHPDGQVRLDGERFGKPDATREPTVATRSSSPRRTGSDSSSRARHRTCLVRMLEPGLGLERQGQ